MDIRGPSHGQKFDLFLRECSLADHFLQPFGDFGITAEGRAEPFSAPLCHLNGTSLLDESLGKEG